MFHAFLSFAHYANGTHEESVRWAQRSIAQNPRYVAVLHHLIGSFVALGRLPEAQYMARRLLTLEPGFRVRCFLARYPLRGAERVEAYAKQLLAAGLPE